MDRNTYPHGRPETPTLVILMMADEEEQKAWDSHPAIREYVPTSDAAEDAR